MKTGAKLLLPLIIFTLLLSVHSNVLAHPGNTAADGCHFCRTNCAKWGEVEDARHCHGGYTAPVEPKTIITITPKPTPRPKAVATPTIKLLETQNPTPEVTSNPSIQGISTEKSVDEVKVIPTPAPELTAGDTVFGLGFLAALIGLPIWLIRKRIAGRTFQK